MKQDIGRFRMNLIVQLAVMTAAWLLPSVFWRKISPAARRAADHNSSAEVRPVRSVF